MVGGVENYTLLAAEDTGAQLLLQKVVVGRATDTVATATTALVDAARSPIDARTLGELTTRGRGLLAHGTSRLAIYKIGSRLERE